MQTAIPSTGHQYTIVSGGLRRLKINSKCHQRVIPIRDCSGSMHGDKEREASEATEALCQELALPANKDGFWVAVIDFSEKAIVTHQLEKASSLVSHLCPLDASRFGGTTNITAGIDFARQILQQASADLGEGSVCYLKPVCVVFSDGEHNDGPPPIVSADRLKAIADVVSVAFGRDADEDTLRQIATSNEHFVRCASGRELRRFFAQVGATLTQTMSARTNATAALANLQQ